MVNSVDAPTLGTENNDNELFCYIEDDYVDWSSIIPTIEYDENLEVDVIYDDFTFTDRIIKEEVATDNEFEDIKKEMDPDESFTSCVEDDTKDLALKQNTDPLNIEAKDWQWEKEIEDAKESFSDFIHGSDKQNKVSCFPKEESTRENKCDGYFLRSRSIYRLSEKSLQKSKGAGNSVVVKVFTSSIARTKIRVKKQGDRNKEKNIDRIDVVTADIAASPKKESWAFTLYDANDIMIGPPLPNRRKRTTRKEGRIGKNNEKKTNRRAKTRRRSYLYNTRSKMVSFAFGNKTKKNYDQRRVKIFPVNKVKLVENSIGKKFSCSACSYASNLKSMIKLHMRRHLAEKPYKCSLCNYASVERSHLIRHMRIHTGDRPHKCSFCDYSCIQKLCLKKHLLKCEKKVLSF